MISNWYRGLSPFGRAWLWFVVILFFVGGIYCTFVAFQPIPTTPAEVASIAPLENQMRETWRAGFLNGVDLACTLGMVLMGLMALDFLYTFFTMRPGPLQRLATSCFSRNRGRKN